MLLTDHVRKPRVQLGERATKYPAMATCSSQYQTLTSPRFNCFKLSFVTFPVHSCFLLGNRVLLRLPCKGTWYGRSRDFNLGRHFPSYLDRYAASRASCEHTVVMHKQQSRACCTKLQATYSSNTFLGLATKKRGSYLPHVPYTFNTTAYSPSCLYQYNCPATSPLVLGCLTSQRPRRPPHSGLCNPPIRSFACEPDPLCIPCT
jgi:hypothetical protein